MNRTKQQLRVILDGLYLLIAEHSHDTIYRRQILNLINYYEEELNLRKVIDQIKEENASG